MELGKRPVDRIRAGLGVDLHKGATITPLCGGKGDAGDADRVNEVRLGREIDDPIARIAVHAGTVHLVLIALLALAGGVDLIARFLLEAVIVGRTGPEGAATREACPSKPRRQLDYAGVNVAAQ